MVHSVTRLPHPSSLTKEDTKREGFPKPAETKLAALVSMLIQSTTSCKQGYAPHLQPSKSQQLLQRAVELIH